MVAMTTYTAIASRDERAWDFRVPGLGNHPEDDLHMQAPTLTEVAVKARNLIALFLEVSENSFDVDVKVELPAAVQKHLQRAAKLRDQAAKAQAEASDEYRAAARELQSDGLTVRDIGVALNVSYQRAYQLISR
jgi:hypothetical protein